MRKVRLIMPLSTLLLALVFAGVILAADFNDLVIAAFPLNAAIQGAQDYEEWFYVAGKPSSGYPNFTAAWLGVYVDGGPGIGFMQVGVITDENGAVWFASSDPDDPNGPIVECIVGQPAWNGRGCTADYYGQFGAEVNRWFKAEIVTYGQGFWILRFYGDDGHTPHDVAKIYFTGQTIWRAESVTEEAWRGDSADQDPYLYAAFYHYEPRYMVWGSGFQPWISGATLRTEPIYVCPDHYGGISGVQNNPKLWFAGTGGPECFVHPLF